MANKTPEGFEVRELHGGQSDVAFDYRIVARRKGYENIRLADMTERWKRMMEHLPKRNATPGARVPLPVPPPGLPPRALKTQAAAKAPPPTLLTRRGR